MSTTAKFKRTLVTSALPYANGFIHLGHLAGAYLPADIYTRFLRSCGEEVIHVSGSDEHGVAIAITAEVEKTTPQDIVDKYHPENEQAFRRIGIDFDIYGRTTWPEHHETSKEFFTALYNEGYLTEREEEQFFDQEAGIFLPDRFVEGVCPNCGHDGARGDQCDNCSSTYNQIELKNPVSKLSGKPPELKTTRHLYFDLGRFQSRLGAYVESHSDDWRDNVLQQSRSWLKMGLGERAITRDLNWGIDVPLDGFEGKKLYVWFDAPFGYITNTRVLAARQGDPDGWKRWWCDPDTRYVAFIGKDNIVFHTIMFPATLMGYNDAGLQNTYIIPDNVPACEFLTLEGKKFSKSRNWGIDLRDYVERFPPDFLRYTLAANLPENKDTDFTWREFQARVNNELADILGNFVNRTMQFAHRYFDGATPRLIDDESKEESVRALIMEDLRRLCTESGDDETIVAELTPKYLKYFTREDLAMLLELYRAPGRIGDLYRRFRFRDAVLETMNTARSANKYFNDARPWKTRTEQPSRCATAINLCLQTVRSLSVLFEPVIPFASTAMLRMLGVEASKGGWAASSELRIPSGHPLGTPMLLFDKIDDGAVEREVAKLGAPALDDAANEPIQIDLKPEVTIDDVLKLDLRIATVLEAERVKKSEKLVKLRIRMGNLERRIVAGIGKAYQPENLAGAKIVVVANLKPARLMGEESQGMLLAANYPDGDLLLVTTMNADARDGGEVR